MQFGSQTESLNACACVCVEFATDRYQRAFTLEEMEFYVAFKGG